MQAADTLFGNDQKYADNWRISMEKWKVHVTAVDSEACPIAINIEGTVWCRALVAEPSKNLWPCRKKDCPFIVSDREGSE